MVKHNLNYASDHCKVLHDHIVARYNDIACAAIEVQIGFPLNVENSMRVHAELNQQLDGKAA